MISPSLSPSSLFVTRNVTFKKMVEIRKKKQPAKLEEQSPSPYNRSYYQVNMSIPHEKR